MDCNSQDIVDCNSYDIEFCDIMNLQVYIPKCVAWRCLREDRDVLYYVSFTVFFSSITIGRFVYFNYNRSPGSH